MNKIKDLIDIFINCRLSGLSSKYLNNDHLRLDELKPLFKVSELGYSVNQETIYCINIGKGRTKVLLWSQMHGNESTSTKSLLDLMNALNNSKLLDILEKCTLFIIPILNPDGARQYTRGNYNKIDLNRDAKNNSQPESKLLNDYYDKIKPDYCFNLHDQRTIYGGDNGISPSGLSFLAPCYDIQSSINVNRRKSMRVIEHIYNDLSLVIKDRIRLYDDDYNEDCFGDHFQKKGASTILFESGFFELDYNREITRKYMFISIVTALNLISDKSKSIIITEYLSIPKNKLIFYDVILKNVNVDSMNVDVGINFIESLKGGDVEFSPYVFARGDLSKYFGHREIDMNNKEIDKGSLAIDYKLNKSLINKLNIKLNL
ncbi:MAG: M14 family zinc carboxypeptidase [Flavobacteriales bacterium]|jgi:hypothetical protein|tara:strand:- start:47358 stop:48479 length:1122 start_codon:yes stop_codon:yes gene_type:complete